ncbi:molybdenum ABC transporter ATP-binding protein [Saccharicrinis aurantiacus]|uniref:molybdenum ABC transporter ATP-binding protein n=1 Tax=Saccharicrinis aurantiacus TaxID=1849719 RepID=UPI000838C8B7|nr:molybdenum ABC transporter ATP-binding protein [Saccharicrinis aurantiacus]
MQSLEIDISLKVGTFDFKMKNSFPPGITGIFGKSGAGKTTLLQCISGVGLRYEGEIKVGTRILSSSNKKIFVPTHKRRVAYVFQEGRLFPHLNVKKNLLYGQRFTSNANSKLNYEEIISLLELRDLQDHLPKNISGGQRQRVALGRALLTNPEVLLLDEPFSALDQQLRIQIIPYIATAAKKLQIPILLVSHDLPDILKLTNRLCIIENGKITSSDSLQNIIQNKHLKNLFPGVINIIDLQVKSIENEQGIIQLNGMNNGNKINILFEPNKQNYNVNDQVRVFLKPDDIVIATEAVKNTSFRNQIKGIVTNIYEDAPRTLCLVDCGFPLICEVSKASLGILSIQTGTNVYCLFKTLSLDSIKL